MAQDDTEVALTSTFQGPVAVDPVSPDRPAARADLMHPAPGGAASTAPVGRPRARGRRRPGSTPREEILDAAAELFTEHGFVQTSTRMLADAVGLRQASIFYHVPTKEAMLAELLHRTVQPSVEFAERTVADAGPADARLFALARFDVALLCSGPFNLGALYLLPEVRDERFADFHAERDRLRCHYGTLVAETLAEVRGARPGEAVLQDLTDLVFGLVESVIPLRQARGALDVTRTAGTVALGCLRLLQVPEARILTVRESHPA